MCNKKSKILIKYFREKEGLTQKELANRIGCNVRALSYYENGKRKAPLSVALKLSQAFMKPVEEIFIYD